MIVNIKKELPPNYDDIIKRFPIVQTKKSIIFCYGDTIYSPHNEFVPDHLKCHEAVHMKRQLATDGGAEAWWETYLKDDSFRFFEEFLAYKEEYYFMKNNAQNRKMRRLAEKSCGKRLASPIYGGLISEAQARKLVSGKMSYEHYRARCKENA